MQEYPKVAIVYLLYYHNKSYVDDAVAALKKMTYPKDKVEFIVVSNEHPKDGSFVHYIEESVMPLSGKEIPHVTILPQKENLGFAGGNNAGTDWALENDFDYVYYHNNDGFFAANALEPIVNAMEKDEKIGIAQSLLLMHPETNLINTAGNSYHYLGFGFCDQYRTEVSTLHLPEVKNISYASGAGFLVSTKLIKKFGAWDHDFFLYHEDLEWSFRLRAAGYKVVMVRDSVFYHKYQFSRSIEKFFWMERNRFAVMLMFFKLPTLILLAPMMIILEAGLWLFALKGKWVGKRVDVWKYWLQPKHWKLWLGKRKKIQKLRIVSDRYLLSFSVPEIRFQEESMKNSLLKYVGNPMMKAYYFVVVKMMIWW
jgi:GT2 family glycosyltransferase